MMPSSDVFIFELYRLDPGEERLWRGQEEIRLTAKAFAVLRYLVTRAGQLVTRDALFDEIWGTPYVTEAALAACIREVRRALEDRAQQPQFVETVRGRGYRFIAAVTTESAPTAVDAPSHRITASIGVFPQTTSVLPPQSTRFVGRECELSDILKRLEEPNCRLLTLTGPGGIGKTRLAIQTAQVLLDAQHYDDGVYVMPLAAVSATGRLAYAIAKGIGLTGGGTASVQQQLLAYLQTRHVLLVLDNFEHLMAETDVIAALLEAAPRVTILVTSREALHILEEWLYPVGGMSIPEADDNDAYPIDDCDAVRLFEQCARRVQPAFTLVDQQTYVARICRLVEGMPLAIELATAWLNVLSPERILLELEGTLDILTSRHRNMPERHRSMRGVLDHSWKLLAEADREVLKQLSVFRDGFRLEAAEAIAGATIAVMANLVATSWLSVEPDGRYRLHELLRQFADEQLRAEPEGERLARERHSIYYLSFVKTHVIEIPGQGQRLALAKMVEEIENVRTGWFRALNEREADAIFWGALGLFRYYQIRGRAQEGEACFGEAIEGLRQHADLQDNSELAFQLCKILYYRSVLCIHIGDYDRTERYARESLALAQDHGWQFEIAITRAELGLVAGCYGRWSEARERLGQGLAIFRGIGYQPGIADILDDLARLDGLYGDYNQARQHASASLAVSRTIQRPDWIAWSLTSLGWVEFCQGNYAEASACYREGYTLFSESGHTRGQAVCLHGRGMVAWGTDRWDDAHHLISQSVAIVRQSGFMSHLSEHLANLSRVALDLSDVQLALAYAREGLAVATNLGHAGFRVSNLCALAAATLRHQGAEESREYLDQALAVAETAQLWPFLMLTRFHLATLLTQGAESVSDSAAKRQALTLLADIREHPATWHIMRARASQLQMALTGALNPPSTHLS